MKKFISPLVAILIPMSFWFFIPAPTGLDINAWRLLGIFIGTVVGIILKVLPIGGVALIGIFAVGISQVTNPGEPAKAMTDALSGFTNTLIWLIGASFFISRGLIKTGLGARIAYHFVKLLGRRTLGISYGLTCAELVLSPVTPSNTARGGGLLYPINRSIAESFSSYPDDSSRRRLGAFLTLVAYQINVITSAMFITATAPNPLVISSIKDLSGIEVTWAQWTLASIVPGLLSLLIIPYVLYRLFAPEIKETPNATEFAKNKLAELGPIKRSEWIMMSVFFFLLCIWSGVPGLLSDHPLMKIDATSGAFAGLTILLCTGVLSWDDILSEKGAWDTITWFSSLVMMATFLNKLGVIPWFSQMVQGSITSLGMTWPLASIALILIFVVSHYFFASNTAHISAMYASFFGVGLSLGAPPVMFGLALGYGASLCASLTHYGTGSAPVLFGPGYVTTAEWWKYGFIVTVINLLIWGVIGSVWWKIIGLW